MSALQVATRPVLEGAPGLKLVPTPAPARGFFGTVIVCTSIFFAGFGLTFALNTKMVDTAYQIQTVRKELNAASAKEATLKDQVLVVSTPQKLTERAQQLGLAPAGAVVHVNLESGAVVAPSK